MSKLCYKTIFLKKIYCCSKWKQFFLILFDTNTNLFCLQMNEKIQYITHEGMAQKMSTIEDSLQLCFLTIITKSIKILHLA